MTTADAYKHFLASSAWAAKRKAVFKRDRWRCTVCGASDRPLHAHHLDYGAPWGEEPLSALTSTCSECHVLMHAPNSWAT